MPPPPTNGAATLLPILGVLTSAPFLWSTGLMFFGMLLLPPVFLIVAVRSEKYSDIFSAPLWRATFAGRLGDLYTLYAVQAGGVAMGMVVMSPLVILGFASGSELGILALVVAMGFLAGLTVTLMGRLCGFFAFGEESPAPAAVQDARDHAPVEAAAEPAEAESPLPPLLDAAERAAAARRRYETDPEGAIAELEGLGAQHAPSPQILHALALLLHAAGRAEKDVEVARAAIALCLKRGHTTLGAEVFAAFWKQSKGLGLVGEQLDVIATALFKTGDPGKAANAFGLALSLDHSDRRAIKGLLQIADHLLHRAGKPKDAARIFTFLLQYASASPFAEDMKRGLAEAEARLQRAV